MSVQSIFTLENKSGLSGPVTWDSFGKKNHREGSGVSRISKMWTSQSILIRKLVWSNPSGRLTRVYPSSHMGECNAFTCK